MTTIDHKITIVTAFFDIGRGNISEIEYPSYLKRTNETYFEYFSNLAKLENNMIIFTSQEFEEKIRKIRGQKSTQVVVTDLTKFNKILAKIENLQKDEKFISRIKPELLKNIEYWSPEYVLLTNLKTYFVSYAIRNLNIDDDLVAWIDFGYVREQKTLNGLKTWKYPFKQDKIHFFTIRKNYSTF